MISLRTSKKRTFLKFVSGVVNNLDNDPAVYYCVVFMMLFLMPSLDGPSLAAAVLIIAKYQYQIAFVADQEINLLAALTEIMVECNFK
jgi:hypothetical protein